MMMLIEQQRSKAKAQVWAVGVVAAVILIACVWGSSSRSKPSEKGQPSVANYLQNIMAIDGARDYIDRAYQPNPDEADWLVCLDIKDGLADSAVEELVRSITRGVHNASADGSADVMAQVNGITIVDGKYDRGDGSIRVSVTR
ncbi:MAG: hypothetical protein ABSD48_15905 [Armatimonadota bacterium]|jgi:hypothetical protein